MIDKRSLCVPRLPSPVGDDPPTHCLRIFLISRVGRHGHGPFVRPLRYHSSLCRRPGHVIHVGLLSERLGWGNAITRPVGVELRTLHRSHRLRPITVGVHCRGWTTRKAGRNWLVERRLPRGRRSVIESLRLAIRLAFGAKRARKILGLRLTLCPRRWAIRASLLRIAVRGRAIVLIGGLLIALLRLRSLVVRVGWSPVVAVDGLSHWRSALHHVRRLRRHSRCAVRRPHDRLRGHRLGPPSHCWVNAEDVRKCGIPGARRLPILRPRIFSPLLVAVVCHVGAPVQYTLCRPWGNRGRGRSSRKTFRREVRWVSRRDRGSGAAGRKGSSSASEQQWLGGACLWSAGAIYGDRGEGVERTWAAMQQTGYRTSLSKARRGAAGNSKHGRGTSAR